MEPLVFEPYFRPQVWGDRRLETFLAKRLPAEGTFGESWEISAHPHHVSKVAEGPLKGQSLVELCANHALELFGERSQAGRPFPLLVKILDCHDQLSVQVHPNDETAHRLLGERNGKTEAWVILAAERNSKVYAGVVAGATRDDFKRHLKDNSVERCLHSFTPKAGDCIFIPAGTVHAVGGGVVIAEVQQTSDATFRLFDWNRLGSDGHPRQLHIDEALESIDWSAGPVRPVEPKSVTATAADVRIEQLVSCQFFRMDRFVSVRSFDVPFAGCLSIWILEDGSAELRGAGYRRLFARGDAVLVPASASGYSWRAAEGSGRAKLLGIHLP